MPSVAFARLSDDYNLPAVTELSIRYSCGVRDEVINQIGLSVLSEMMSPTAAGRMLVETSSLLLAARLAHSHSETELIRSPIGSGHGLDGGRLRRVLAYIQEHLVEDITVADLANVGGRWGGASTAAVFLKEFAETTPWVHLDIAGTAWLDDTKPYLAKGPTGVALRTLVRVATDWQTS